MRRPAVLIGISFRFQERKTLSSQPDGWIEEYLREGTETDAGRPVIETITTHRTYTTHTKPETGEGDTDIVYRVLRKSFCLSLYSAKKKNTRNEMHAQIDHFSSSPQSLFQSELKCEIFALVICSNLSVNEH